LLENSCLKLFKIATCLKYFVYFVSIVLKLNFLTTLYKPFSVSESNLKAIFVEQNIVFFLNSF